MMELLALLLPLGLLAIIGLSGGGSDDDSEEAPDGEPVEGIVEGTPAGDDYEGSAGGDMIFGARGADTVDGADGDDVLLGEGGDDALFGGAASDLVFGGRGNDTLEGGNDSDLLLGGAGDDLSDGGAGPDSVIDISGSDTLHGGEGNDIVSGFDLRPGDSVGEVVPFDSEDLREVVANTFGIDAANTYRDRLEVGRTSSDPAMTGADEVFGDAGDDLVLGDLGDTLSGGAGVDRFTVYTTPGDAAVELTDYDPEEENIELLVYGTPPGVFSVTDAAGGAELRLDGEVVVRLSGIPASAVDPGRIALIPAG